MTITYKHLYITLWYKVHLSTSRYNNLIFFFLWGREGKLSNIKFFKEQSFFLFQIWRTIKVKQSQKG